MKSGCLLSDTRGRVTYKTLIWLVILSLAGYAGYKFAVPYAAYFMMKTAVEEETKVAHMYTDEFLAKRLLKNAEAWDIPIDREDIIIDRDTDIMIRIRYTVTVTLFNRYNKDLSFEIRVTAPLKETTRILQ
ncbi:MAG: hypothetical protein HZB21_02315 [Deltaproteobacteria bacterium]|nr:hypothetical protein [Deltaproteobacteria bacterium]